MERTPVTILAAMLSLAGCASTSVMKDAVPSLGSQRSTASAARATTSLELVNLDYSNGAITVYSVRNGRAQRRATFSPGNGVAQGLAVDAAGNVYTDITPTSAKPCAACVEIYTSAGKFVKRLPAPSLPGAPGAPFLTDVSVDSRDDVYVSDYGQQAVYFFPNAGKGGFTPTVVVQNSSNAASVVAQPNGVNLFVSGGCGFASVRPYTFTAAVRYVPGECFGIGTIALIGGAADNLSEVFTPVDGVPALVSISSPTGGTIFHTPDRRYASISGVALSGDASVAYVANAQKKCVYAFSRPANGWLSGVQPKLLATYKGFGNLDIIAVRP